MTEIDTSTAAIAALMDGVTPGPWTTDTGGEVQTIGGTPLFAWPRLSGAMDDLAQNAMFCAAARELVPALATERDAAVARAEQAEARVAELEAPSAENARPAWLANCCICGRVVDTREVSEGGDQHGCQYDGGWVCSSDCGCRLLGDPTEAEEHAAHEAEARAQGMREAAEMLDNPRLWGCGRPLSRLVSAILARAEEIETEARET